MLYRLFFYLTFCIFRGIYGTKLYLWNSYDPFIIPILTWKWKWNFQLVKSWLKLITYLQLQLINLECFGAQTQVWGLFKEDTWQIIDVTITYLYEYYILYEKYISQNMFYSKTLWKTTKKQSCVPNLRLKLKKRAFSKFLFIYLLFVWVQYQTFPLDEVCFPFCLL